MMIYVLEVAFAWLVFFLTYLLFLQKETHFSLNRAYLLCALIGGLFLPFIQIETSSAYLNQLPVLLDEISVSAAGNAFVESEVATHFSIWNLLSAIYILGIFVGFIRMGWGLYKIQGLFHQAEIENKGDFCLVKTASLHSPFSFGKYLFISQQLSFNDKEYHYIIEHESTHIRQHHSADVLFLEVLSILFWFNPLIFLYKTALRDQHEYLADKAVLHQAPIKEYGQLLIEQSIPGLKIGLVNHLIYSQLKKRINMMTKKRSLGLPYLRVALCCSSFLFVFGLISCKKEVPKEDKAAQRAEILTKKPSSKAMSLPEGLPYLESCESGDYQASKNASDYKILEHIYKHLKYPKESSKNGVEGMAVLSFDITVEGQMENIELLKTPDEACGKEAMRVLEMMKNDANMKWVPGNKDGKLVKVNQKLPIRFKLE